MKHRATKERRRCREEFVYKWRDLFQDLKKASSPLQHSDPGKKVVPLARTELGYNGKTNDIDIILSLRRTFSKLFPEQ